MTINGMRQLASLYFESNPPAKGLRLVREFLPHVQKAIGSKRQQDLQAITDLAAGLASAGHFSEAIQLQEAVLPLKLEVLGGKHPDTLTAKGNLAKMLIQTGRADEAVKLLEELLPLRREVSGPEDVLTMNTMVDLATAYGGADHPEKTVPLCKTVNGERHPHTLTAMANLASFYLMDRQTSRAYTLYESLFKLSPNDLDSLNSAAWNLSVYPDDKGQFPYGAQAESWARRLNQLVPNDGSLLNTLGIASYRTGNWADAVKALKDSIGLGQDKSPNWLFLAMVLHQLKLHDESRTWYDKSLAWKRANETEVEGDVELQSFYAEAARLMAPAQTSDDDHEDAAAPAPKHTELK